VTAPFHAPPQRLGPVIGAVELLDALAMAESAELEARHMRQRVRGMVAKYSAERGYPVPLRPEQARNMAMAEAQQMQAHRAGRRAA
jgi:hypothetical protein